MRELTEVQQAAKEKSRAELLKEISLDSLEVIAPHLLIDGSHRAGFIAGLETQDARISELEAKLTAYRAFVSGQITVDELMKAVEL